MQRILFVLLLCDMCEIILHHAKGLKMGCKVFTSIRNCFFRLLFVSFLC